MTTSEARYHFLSTLLHWVIAGLIVLQYVLANLAEAAADAGTILKQIGLIANHKSVGITILGLAIIRLAWRRFVPPPELPSGMARWQTLASRASHWTLYALMILLPLSGWLFSSAAAFSVSWFNLVQLPDMVAPNERLEAILHGTHVVLARALFVLALLHLLAALKHAVIDRDGVLRRMSSPISIVAGILVLVAGAVALADPADQRDNDVDALPGDAALADWQIDYDNSYIQFTGEQAGATFDGTWQDWSAKMRFDADNLQSSLFDVAIRTARVETRDDDRDETIRSSEWFDSARYPEAYFRASSFTATPAGFEASGELTIKGYSAPVVLAFTVEADGNRRILNGTSALKRLKLRVGTGEWEDTRWIGDEVLVSVRVSATLPE